MDQLDKGDKNDPFNPLGKDSLDSLAFEDPSWGVAAALENEQDKWMNFADGAPAFGSKSGDGVASRQSASHGLSFDPGKQNPFDFLEAGLQEDRKGSGGGDGGMAAAAAAVVGANAWGIEKVPVGKGTKAVWYEGWDDVHKCYYYFNEVTKESRWTKPDEPFIEYGEDEGEEEDEEEDGEGEDDSDDNEGEDQRSSQIDESDWSPTAASRLSISSPTLPPAASDPSPPAPPAAPTLKLPANTLSPSTLSPAAPSSSSSEPSPVLKKEMAKKEALLCSLTGCGIGRANEALRRHKGDTNAAADWLLTNPIEEGGVEDDENDLLSAAQPSSLPSSSSSSLPPPPPTTGDIHVPPASPSIPPPSAFDDAVRAITAPPSEFECPITLTLMSDPCIASDGFTYERSAMSDWLKRSKTSPKTGEKIGDTLIPNKTLKTMIGEWVEKQNIKEEKEALKCRRFTKSHRFK